MSDRRNVTRRNFMQTTAAGASVLALTAGVSRTSTAANNDLIMGWIGCGGRGKSDMKRALTVPGVKVVAVCDLKEDRAQQAAAICEEAGIKAKIYTDFRKMLDTEKLDACAVCTEVGNHAKCAVPVLEAGLHCFSEKPMDCTVEKVDAVVKAARKAKGIYQIGFQRRYNVNYQKCVKSIHDGDIGQVHFMQGHWHWTWDIGNGWVADVDMSGGEIVEQACHHMDVMSWVMKSEQPINCVAMGVSTKALNNPPEHQTEDKSAVTFQFADGALFSYTHLFRLCDPFTGEMLRVTGENGGVDICEGMRYPRPNQGDPVQLAAKSDDWDAATREEFVAFADHCRKGEMPLSNVETGRVATLMSLMAHEAMYVRASKKFEPRLVTWKDLHTTTNKA